MGTRLNAWAITAICLALGTFLHAGPPRRGGSRKARTKRQADRNKDGKVDPREKHDFKENDTNNDGRIDREERADRDNDGDVDRKEAHDARRKVNTAIEKKYDADGDGHLSKEEQEQLKAGEDTDGDGKVSGFERADKNDDGIVGAREGWYAKRKVDTAAEKAADSNGDGWVDKEEAKDLRRKQLFDSNDDGTLSDEEETRAKKAVVDTDIEEEFDEDGDGYISQEEAKALRQELAARRMKKKSGAE